MDAHIYKQLISTKVQSQFIGETRAFLTNGARTIGYLHTKKKKKEFQYVTYTIYKNYLRKPKHY